MDIKVTTEGAIIDDNKPYTGLFNYDATPTRDIIKSNLVNHIVEYRDDFLRDSESLRRANKNSALVFDYAGGTGSARIDIEGERFDMVLTANPDIPIGASVRVSAYEAVNHNSYGVLDDASPDTDVWTVRMLEGGKVSYSRDELADLSSRTTVDGQIGTEIAIEALYEIGEYVIYTGNPTDRPPRVVQVMSRRYTPGMSELPWSYWCRDIETGVTNLHLGERALSTLPRNLQNLAIIERPG